MCSAARMGQMARVASDVLVVEAPAATWAADASNCARCETTFTIFNRRHHCRVCGLCVCDACAPISRVLIRPAAEDSQATASSTGSRSNRTTASIDTRGPTRMRVCGVCAGGSSNQSTTAASSSSADSRADTRGSREASQRGMLTAVRYTDGGLLESSQFMGLGPAPLSAVYDAARPAFGGVGSARGGSTRSSSPTASLADDASSVSVSEAYPSPYGSYSASEAGRSRGSSISVASSVSMASVAAPGSSNSSRGGANGGSGSASASSSDAGSVLSSTTTSRPASVPCTYCAKRFRRCGDTPCLDGGSSVFCSKDCYAMVLLARQAHEEEMQARAQQVQQRQPLALAPELMPRHAQRMAGAAAAAAVANAAGPQLLLHAINGRAPAPAPATAVAAGR